MNFDTVSDDVKSLIMRKANARDLCSFEETAASSYSLSSKYFLWKHQYYKLFKQFQPILTKIKDHTFENTFVGHFQSLICDINDDIVRCGCLQCTHKYGGNYPRYELNLTNQQDEQNYWKSSQGVMVNIGSANTCALFQWIQQCCVKVGCIVPAYDVDSPHLHPRSFIMIQCLSNWMQLIKSLPFHLQKTTVYMVMYHMYHYDDDEDVRTPFLEWFDIDGRLFMDEITEAREPACNVEWKFNWYLLTSSFSVGLMEIKKLVLAPMFPSMFQHDIGNVNSKFVKCGCPNCTNTMAMNYPSDEDRSMWDGKTDRRFWWNSSVHNTNVAHQQFRQLEDNGCALFKWFQKFCKIYSCPVPQEIDNPVHYAYDYSLAQCLSKPLGNQDSDDSDDGMDSTNSYDIDDHFYFDSYVDDDDNENYHWIMRIRKFPLYLQIPTLLMFYNLHFYENIRNGDEVPSFKEWLNVDDEILFLAKEYHEREIC